MKLLNILIIFILYSSCQNRQSGLLDNFINEIYLNEKYDLLEVNEFMSDSYLAKLKSLDPKKREIHEKYILEMIEGIRKTLANEQDNYKLVNSDQLISNIKEKINLNTNNYYCLFSNKNELLSIFIIENGKLLTFCLDIYNSKENSIAPYYFFEDITKH